MPHYVEINIGTKTVTARRGSVNIPEFPVLATRPVLLHIQDAQSQVLLKGDGVFTDKHRFVTIVLDNGNVFLSDGQSS